MDNQELQAEFSRLSTPHLFDACLRLGAPVRSSSSGIVPLKPGMRIAGRVMPAKHYGSVDVFLEAMEAAGPGDILVIDNQGRLDEGCIGDLTVLEARNAGLSGMIVWGAHRDTGELVEIGFPVFSRGSCPMGPRRLDPRDRNALSEARFEGFIVGRDDFVFADDDGAVFAPMAAASDLLSAAREIRTKERAQADAVRSGRSLREQLEFKDYLGRRALDGAYSFRAHLKRLGGAIEE